MASYFIRAVGLNTELGNVEVFLSGIYSIDLTKIKGNPMLHLKEMLLPEFKAQNKDVKDIDITALNLV